MSGRSIFSLVFFFRRLVIQIVEYRTDLLRLRTWQESLCQRMQCGFEFLAIRFTQGYALSAIDDPIQFFHIHVNAPGAELSSS
jgi:hypothetical protein